MRKALDGKPYKRDEFDLWYTTASQAMWDEAQPVGMKAQKEVFTIEPNSWLMDRRLDGARAGLTSVMFDLSRVRDLRIDVESMWRGLQRIETA